MRLGLADTWRVHAGFWGFGVILGWTLAFKAGLGLQGLWCSSAAAALLLPFCINLSAFVRLFWRREYHLCFLLFGLDQTYLVYFGAICDNQHHIQRCSVDISTVY